MFKSISNFFIKNKNIKHNLPKIDLHSHLLPGIDDGVKTVEESIAILKAYQNAGFKKVITTPHIRQDYYPHSPETILSKLNEVRDAFRSEGLAIEFNAAAEYYLDEIFLSAVKSERKLLTLGENYLLFETAFQDKPLFLEKAIFELLSKG